jgi:hypothetical protein
MVSSGEQKTGNFHKWFLKAKTSEKVERSIRLRAEKTIKEKSSRRKMQ